MAATERKTCLSAGALIRDILLLNQEVAGNVTKIFPVFTPRADLPYIVYRRAGLEPDPNKGRLPRDVVAVELSCYTAGYSEGVVLAEAVRSALEGVQTSHSGLSLRSCVLTDAEEYFDNDAYVQSLTFALRISGTNFNPQTN